MPSDDGSFVWILREWIYRFELAPAGVWPDALPDLNRLPADPSERPHLVSVHGFGVSSGHQSGTVRRERD
jgi:hypothetical protein